MPSGSSNVALPSAAGRHRAWTLAAGLLCVAAGAVPLWRAALPNNQHRDSDLGGETPPGEVWGQNADGYDDVVTVVTARNFRRDGFLRTHLLPNRKGAPLASYLDFGHNQCLSLDAAQAPAPRYRTVMGEWIDLRSVTGDCIYTHYPPLADWIFGAVAAAGLESILAYRAVAIAVSCLTLLLLAHWLRREVHPVAALVAVALIGFSPAFFHWAAALFHVTFQYLFLVAGLLAWSRFLEARRRRWFAVTFALFFLEALVSYELVAFFAIMLAGLAALDGREVGWGRRIGWLAVLALAPVGAVLLHLALRVSLFGLGPTWQNLVETAAARAGTGWTELREAVWWNRLGLRLLRFDLAAMAVVLVAVARVVARARPWRALALLGILLAGGVSFLALFRGTTWLHSWMMYRHLLPATALLLALVVDAGILCLRRIGPAPEASPPRRPLARSAAAVGAALALAPVLWSGHQSALALRRELRWQRSLNAHVDPENLAVRHLDVIHWFEGDVSWYDVRPLLAVSGRRVNDPPAWETSSPLFDEVRQHFDVWWLDEASLSSVRFLFDAAALEAVASHCDVSWFDGARFVEVDRAGATPRPFEAGPGEQSRVDLVWWQFPLPVRTRAVRLTCAGLPGEKLLHQIEAR